MEWYMYSENHDGEGKKIFGGNFANPNPNPDQQLWHNFYLHKFYFNDNIFGPVVTYREISELW